MRITLNVVCKLAISIMLTLSCKNLPYLLKPKVLQPWSIIIDLESTYFQFIVKLERTEMQIQRNVKYVKVTL